MKTSVATDTTFGSIFAHVVQKKGVEEDKYSLDKLAGDVAWRGCCEVTPKNNSEPAIVRLLKEVLGSFSVSFVDKAVWDHNGNGAAENAVEQVRGLLGTHKSALERHANNRIPREHPLVARMVEYVASLLTTRRVKSNGPAPYQHLRGGQLVQPSCAVENNAPGSCARKASNAKSPARSSLDGNGGSPEASCARPMGMRSGTPRRETSSRHGACTA